jgi:separase
MAACELLRPPTQISLKQLITSIPIDGATDLEEERRCVVGAILERQVESLSGNLWKPDVQSVVMALLSDCIATYDAANRPIRRAGVMLKILELSYYSGAADEDLRLSESAEEIEGLLSQDVRTFTHRSQNLPFYNLIIESWTRCRDDTFACFT